MVVLGAIATVMSVRHMLTCMDCMAKMATCSCVHVQKTSTFSQRTYHSFI